MLPPWPSGAGRQVYLQEGEPVVFKHAEHFKQNMYSEALAARPYTTYLKDFTACVYIYCLKINNFIDS